MGGQSERDQYLCGEVLELPLLFFSASYILPE